MTSGNSLSELPSKRPNGIAAQSLGIAEGALAEAKEYTKGRVQFGKPISKFQNTQFTFADMELGCEAGRLLTYQAAVLKGEGKRYTKEAAMAKLFTSEHAMKTTTKALQMFGGYGYTKAAEKGNKTYFASEESAIRIICPDPEKIAAVDGGRCV